MNWYMPVEVLMQLPSNDAMQDFDRHNLKGITVADALTVKEIDDEYHQRIMKVMAREKINRVPILVINDTVYNGHRRIMIADVLGLEMLLCTDDENDSGWWDEDTVIGEEETQCVRLETWKTVSRNSKKLSMRHVVISQRPGLR